MRSKRAATAAALATGIVLAAAGCTASAGTSSGPLPAARTIVPGSSSMPASADTPPGPAAAWPTYGQNAQRTDVASVAPAGPLSLAWSARLDGAVYGQPLLVGGMVIAATEHDSIYALNAANGHVDWRVSVGTPVPLSELPCGGIDPLGITGTPVYDRDYGLIYAVAETSGYHHVLVGVSVADGTIKVERDIPAPDGQPKYDQQRPGLAIEGGRVYIAFGGYHDSQGDLDLGSTQPALLADGLILADGKSGTAYLLNAAHLGGVGGQLAQRQVCGAYGGAAVSGNTVYEPCEQGGMAAIGTVGNSIRILWRGPSNAAGSPVVGGDAVWVTDYSGGRLYELNPATGTTRYSLPLGTALPHFASMSMSGHDAYLGTDDGVTAVAGA